MDHIGTEMLVLDRLPVPGDSRFPRTVHPMVFDPPCIPAVVLIVEDEMMLRMFAVNMVEVAGYTPVEAVDADEAIAILESRSDIALMCTDIQMPGSMDGLGLAHAVHERWPSIKIIVVSGQLPPSSVDLPPCSRFFGKPLQAGEMITQMQSMIGHA
jgi:CheY-like chemotaxis protein